MGTISQDTLSEMSKELFAASGAMYQMATQMMVLQTLLRHPDVWAAKHREMPEVAAFKANLSPEGMRDYLKTQILNTTPMVSQGNRQYSVWDALSQVVTSSHIQGSSVWEDDPEDFGEGTSRQNREGSEEEQQYGYDQDDEDDEEEVVRPPRKRAQKDPFDQMWRELDKEDAWLSQDSPSEAALYVTQADPSPPSRKSVKGKQPGYLRLKGFGAILSPVTINPDIDIYIYIQVIAT